MISFIKNKSAGHLYFLSVLSGVLLALSWPVDGFPFLLFIAFVPLLFVDDFIDRHRAFFHKYSIFKFAYLTFFVWNLLTVWWIWNSTVFGGMMALLLNPLFMTVTFMVFHLSKRVFLNRSNAVYLLLFYWIAFEYLHLDWDLSFPWLNLGNGFAMYPRFVQWYEFTGTLGGSFWILLVNILLFKWLKQLTRVPRSRTLLIVNGVIIILFLAVPMLISLRLYNNYEEKGETAEVIISQPNIDPWSEQYTLPTSEVIRRTFDPVKPLLTQNTEFVVCPESAIQEDLWHHNINKSRSIRKIRELMAGYPNLNMVIGASTFRLFGENESLTNTARKFNDVDKYYEAFNTALFINAREEIGMYHKSRLVPGPEKMPFQRLLRPLQNLAFDLGGTVGSLGYSPERTVFTSMDGKFKVPAIICYESIYGDFCAGFVRNGANMLFLITNDGWWGDTPGYRQHYSFAILRAVETRRVVARSANTGISAFVNQRGDVLQKTGYWEPAVLKENLNANNEMTFYVKYGDYFGRISTFLTILLLLISVTFSITQKRKNRT